MSFQLLPLPPSEWHLYLKIAEAAFSPGILSVMYPNGFSEKAQQHSLSSMERTSNQYPGRIRLFKVVDPSLPADDPYNKIIGVSQWKIFPTERSSQELQAEDAWDEQDNKQYGWPEGIDTKVVQDFYGQTSAYKAKHLGGKPYVLLHVLATRPDYGRKGVGAVSLKRGCDIADELGVPAYLEGSPMGVGLYKKWGFDVVDELPWDAREYGYHEPLTHMCMKREPKHTQR